MKKYLAIFIIFSILSSCSATKECREPNIDMPERFSSMSDDSITIADMEWWQFYGDTLLCGLIGKALENNKDLLVAVAKIEEAKAIYGISKADLLPLVNILAYGNRETNDYSEKNHVTDPEYGIKGRMSWEADLWGNLKWGKRGAEARYWSAIENERAIRISLIAEIAEVYFNLMALDNELAIVRRTLTTRKENVDQAKIRFEGGLTSEMVYRQAQVELASTAALVPSLDSNLDKLKSAISILIGEFPGNDIGRNALNTQMLLPESLPIGIPSDLLKRRPDVRAAEQNLKSAMANVGVAYTDRFPKFTINLTGGLENDRLLGFFKSPFSFIEGGLAGPLIDFGRRKKKYKASLAAYEQSCLAYEKTVLTAFKEAGDAVVDYRSARESTLLKVGLRDAAFKYVELAHIQYRGGSINYIDVLDAQRRYFDAQIGLSNAVRDEHLALVRLYKSLGGGWKYRN